jgi:putative transposase
MSDKYTIDLFTRSSLKDIVVDSLKFCKREKGLIVYAWCLMPSHLHLIASAREGYDLSATIRDFKKHTNKAIISEIKQGHESRREWLLTTFSEEAVRLKRVKNYKVWQDGNMAKELLTGAMAIQKLEYVHNNPIEARIVNEASHYLYSSALAYECKPGLIDVEFLY